MTPMTAYGGGKGWPSDRPIPEIIAAYKSFYKLNETTTDGGQYKAWLNLEVTAHRKVLEMRGVDVDDLDTRIYAEMTDD